MNKGRLRSCKQVDASSAKAFTKMSPKPNIFHYDIRKLFSSNQNHNATKRDTLVSRTRPLTACLVPWSIFKIIFVVVHFFSRQIWFYHMAINAPINLIFSGTKSITSLPQLTWFCAQPWIRIVRLIWETRRLYWEQLKNWKEKKYDIEILFCVQEEPIYRHIKINK